MLCCVFANTYKNIFFNAGDFCVTAANVFFPLFTEVFAFIYSKPFRNTYVTQTFMTKHANIFVTITQILI